MKKFSMIYILTVLVLFTGGLAQAEVLEVGSPGGGIGTLADIYPNIQAAIDDADPGDTVVVHAGLYTENIDINKWIILEGDGEGNNPAVDTIITAAVGDHPTVQIQASGASGTDRLIIRNLRVTGAIGSGNPGSGIELDTGSNFVTIESVTVTGNSAHGLNADVMGLIEDLQVIDCNLSGNGGAGLNQNSYVSIDGLVINDCNVNNNANGLYLEGPLTGLTLSGGSFNDNLGGGTNGVGIYATRINDFLVKKTVSLSNFTASGNKRGLIFNKFYGPFSVSNATVSDNLEEGIVVAPGASVSDPISFTNITVENNPKWNLWFISYLGYAVTDVTLDNVTATGSTDASNGYGIYLYASTDSTLSNVTVADCVMSGNNNGLYLRAANASATITNVDVSVSEIVSNLVNGVLISDYAAAGNKINNSKITANTFAVNNLGTIDFDATLNWWGDPTGPFNAAANPAGLANAVSDYVDFDPWFTTEDMLEPVIVYVGDGPDIRAYASTLQEAIDVAYDGDKIFVTLGTYNESIDIYKDYLTLEGEVGSMPSITGGLILNTNVTGLTLKNFEISGEAVPGKSTIVRMYGAITDLTIDNCVFDGENVSDRSGFTGGQLEGDVSVTNCEFKNILGWAVLESRSGSGGDGSAMATVTFANNNVHNCNGSVVFRGLSTDRTDVVNAYGNTFKDIGGNKNQQGQHWAALEINRTVLANVYNNDVNGVSEGEWGEGQALQLWDIDTLDVHDNNFVNNFQGIWVYGSDPISDDPFPVPGGAIYCNNIGDSNDYGISVDPAATGGPLNAENNWWGDATGPSGDGGGTGSAVYGNVDFFPWLLSTDCGDITIEVVDYVVDDNWVGLPDWYTVTVEGTDYYIGLNAFDTIQGAIDAASDGNSISVAAGTYNEAVLIEKSLNIRGATADLNKNGYPVPANYAWDPDVESIINHPDPASGYVAIVDIFDVNDVTFEGFVVQELHAVGNLNTSLLRVRAETHEITNINVRNNVIGGNTNVDDQDGKQGRMGLYIVNRPYDDKGVVNSTFAGNKIFDCKGNGDNVFIWTSYYAYGAPGPASMRGTVIEDNEIYGSHRAGIEIAGGFSDLIIRRNVIYGNTGLPSDDPNHLKYGNGILLIRGSSDKLGGATTAYGPVNVTIKGNEIFGNEKNGIYSGPILNDVSITGNEIYDNGWDAVRVDLEGTYWNPTFEPEPNDWSCYDAASDVEVSYNNIFGNGAGVELIGTPTNGLVIDAEYNWWGDASGPEDLIGTMETDGVTCYDVSVMENTDGTGNGASENVDYCPWSAVPIVASDSLCPAGDLDGDCDVDFADFAMFADNWLEGTEE